VVTALERQIREIVAEEGPLTVERYMALCLGHYYGSRDPLGAGGDFTTAPEISQMFGELLGLWSVAVWQAMGSPPLRLVELGPGRGTLMVDALRAARLVPAFLGSLSVHLVETSPALRERQRQALAAAGVPIAWHDRMEDVPPGPAIVLANEFVDALPIRQFVAAERGWHERVVGLDGERLVFGLAPSPQPGPTPLPPPGTIREEAPVAARTARALAERLAGQGGAALLVDYGYWGPATGDTLQALKAHAPIDPLTACGEADLTAHVDFAALAAAAQDGGAAVHGPSDQASFLEALGIVERAASLKARANPAQGEAVEAALRRLTDRAPAGMGSLFKVLGLSQPGLALPGLAAR
jgi:SAM-dependent MidA family methyltransferase